MKPYLFLFCLFASSCTTPIDRSLPAEEDNQQIPLGLFTLSENTISQVPYFGRSQVIFKDQNGKDILMRITTPAYSPEINLLQTYPDPNNSSKDIDYSYKGERYGIQLQGLETGTIIDIELLPGICEDPRLEEMDIVQEQIRIGIIGFFPYEFTQFLNPLLQVSANEHVICTQRPDVSSRQLSVIELGGKTFEEVYYTNTLYGGYDIEIFFNATWGVVAIRVNDLEWVVDRW